MTHSLSLGQIIVDSKSSKRLTSEDIIPALRRHILGDWGKVTKQRRSANQIALSKGKPLHSVYFSDEGIRFGVVTSADRSQTIVKVLKTHH